MPAAPAPVRRRFADPSAFDDWVARWRQRLASEPQAPQFEPGEKVQVHGGSFIDLEAIFVSADGEKRSVILLNLLQREQKVRVPNRYLCSIPAQPAFSLACRAD